MASNQQMVTHQLKPISLERQTELASFPELASLPERQTEVASFPGLRTTELASFPGLRTTELASFPGLRTTELASFPGLGMRLRQNREVQSMQIQDMLDCSPCLLDSPLYA